MLASALAREQQKCDPKSRAKLEEPCKGGDGSKLARVHEDDEYDMYGSSCNLRRVGRNRRMTVVCSCFDDIHI